VSCICGAVANTAAYLSERHDHNYTRMQNFVNESVYHNDIAYAEPIAYEAARAHARDAYFPNPDFDIIALMSQQQRNSITVMLVRSEWSAAVARAPGGTWEDTGQDLAPLDHPFFGNLNLGFLTWRFSGLHVYRRR
jgi:hypothetical protein